jgi:hypothetical protein
MNDPNVYWISWPLSWPVQSPARMTPRAIASMTTRRFVTTMMKGA